MSEVLIVSKTKMSDKLCVGALELSTNKFLRLLNSNGYNQSQDTKFDIGDIWNISYTPKQSLTAPHMEDVMVSAQIYIRHKSGLSSFLQSQNIPIWKGNASNLFDGCICFAENTGSGYISNASIPQQSVGFWISDKDLIKNVYEGKIRYCYRYTPKQYTNQKTLAYVGLSYAPDIILAGTLIRVSLARWWTPPNATQAHCYLQLSGWYD